MSSFTTITRLQGKILGFTGTRKGLTRKQYKMLKTALKILVPNEIHHGDCKGADEKLHKYFSGLKRFRHIPIIIHPGFGRNGKSDTRALCKFGTIVLLEEKSYLRRDKDIAKACDYLVVCPDTKSERIRSGTWVTARYAREMKKPLFIIFPDGTTRYVKGKIKSKQNGGLAR